ncbi:MAG: ribosome assembly RNA-binding protein YhbY [Magnetococcales bacterium]|nr:ribosome assembly RNA-binding protein YhbY [Magnetococcales bacterium]
MLTGTQRKYLRGLAHGLNPVVTIGKDGVTPGVLGEVDRGLRDHELIKVRFGGFKEEKEALSQQIAESTGSDVAGMIGHVLILYRAAAEPEKRVIVLP